MAAPEGFNENEHAEGRTDRTSDSSDDTTGTDLHHSASAAPILSRTAKPATSDLEDLKVTTSGVSHARGSTDEIELEERDKRFEAGSDTQMAGFATEKEAGGFDGPPAERTVSNVMGRGSGEDGAPEGGYRSYKRRWFGLVQLTLLNIIVSWDWICFSPVSDKAAAYFNTSEANVNWLSTAFLFAFVAATPVVIYVLHLGPRPSFIAASLLILVGNWVRYAGVHSKDGGILGVVMFGQILTGLAQPFVLSAPTRYSDLWFTNRGRVAATALMSLANPFGAAIGQLIVPFWVNVPGDVSRMVLYVSIISSVCTIPSFFVPAAPPTPIAPSSETPKLTLKESVKILTEHVEFWLIFIPFSVYVGLFNALSSLLNQILEPYGYDSDNAGIAGAVLIVVGLVSSAITSPILDRTKTFLLAVRVAVPIIGLSYLAFYWMPNTYPSLAGPFVVLAIVGASSFSLVPVAVELLVEVTHPISPEVTATIGWGGGQFLGGVFIIIMDALKDNGQADPPYNMSRALIFTALMALVVVPFPLCLGLFGRAEKVRLRRVHSDQAVLEARRPPAA